MFFVGKFQKEGICSLLPSMGILLSSSYLEIYHSSLWNKARQGVSGWSWRFFCKYTYAKRRKCITLCIARGCPTKIWKNTMTKVSLGNTLKSAPNQSKWKTALSKLILPWNFKISIQFLMRVSFQYKNKPLVSSGWAPFLGGHSGL